MKKILRKKYVKGRSFEKQIRDILNNFDFDRVAKFANWKFARRVYDEEGQPLGTEEWRIYIPDKGYTVPTANDLKKSAERILRDVIKSAEKSRICMVHCGLFKAYFNHGYLNLDCVIEYQDSYD